MNYRTRLKQLLIATLLLWSVCAIAVGMITFSVISLPAWVLLMLVLVMAAVASLLTLNQSQQEVAEANKLHSRTKRQVQEQQLKIDRYEYDTKKSGEMRRIVLNSTQEKDHSLRNMAVALDHAMNEIIELTGAEAADDVIEQVRTRAEGMKRYAADLQSLARLELKSELPDCQELEFLPELNRFIDDWNTLGKGRGVKIKLDNPEDQMPLKSDLNWIENILARVAQSLIRMNRDTTLHLHLIGYQDAELGDAMRLEFTIAGRNLSEQQLNNILTEYISVVEDGQEIGPGLSFVVARRVAQMLNGFVEVTNGAKGMQVLVVLPRNSMPQEDDDEAVGVFG